MPVSTWANSTYRMVQTTSEPMMPMGMLLLRVLRLLGGGGNGIESDEGEEDHSGGARMPLQPNSPKVPVFGGMKGV